MDASEDVRAAESWDEARGRLGPTEQRLLDYLLSRPERVHGRRELLRAVWTDRVPGPRAVDAAIARTRLALGPSGDAIVTVRRVGYRLDPSRLIGGTRRGRRH